MADGVTTGVVAGIADRWKIFSIRLPGFAGREEVADDVVVRRANANGRSVSWCVSRGK
jgi:hypothetical protein